MANLGPRERNLLSNAIDSIAHRFDILIIDTGAGIGSNAVSFASSADDVLLVATPDPTSLRDAYAMAKVLNRRSGVEHMHLIANQVSSEREGAKLHDQMQEIVKRFLSLDLRYLGCIPRDDVVRQSVAAGEPFVLRAPSSAPTRAVQMLVQRLLAESSPSPRSLS
jgi:flagellar biosynthesis protein FlhG